MKEVKPRGRVVEKNCVVCNTVFFTPSDDSRRSCKKQRLRRRNSTTCSPKCSKANYRKKVE